MDGYLTIVNGIVTKVSLSRPEYLGLVSASGQTIEQWFEQEKILGRTWTVIEESNNKEKGQVIWIYY